MFNPQPKKGMPPKKERKPLKRSAIKKKFKKTGEGETFERVIENLGEVETRCFVCDIPIALVTHNNFAHILNKKQYPLFRNEPENIRIMCHSIISRINEKTRLPTNGCHSDYDTKPRSKLTHEMWDKVWELQEELKQAYKEYENSNV